MQAKGFSIRTIAVLAVLAVTVYMTSAWAVTEKVLRDFTDGRRGAFPAGVIFDASGNLYGTTFYGGGSESCNAGYGHSCGTVFELTPKVGGGWTEKVLHSFSPTDRGGFNPSSGVIFDASGNLYGTTSGGGRQGCGYGGTLCGTVFELTRTAGGGWKEKVLHSFRADGKDGQHPRAGLIFDASGNLYGTTWYGGSGSCYDGNGHGCGTVFELTPRAGGVWKEKILCSFKGNGKDGVWPNGSLIFDKSGNLYGVTLESAFVIGGYGTVFELQKSVGGWRLIILHAFNGDGKDGNNPTGSLVFDTSGNLYGATIAGPPQGYDGPCQDGTDTGCGTVFELSPKVTGGWTEKILHYFKSNGEDGYNPSAGLIFDASGNLYSSTEYGGSNDDGTVYELTPTAGEGWAEKVLHSFDYKNGFAPGALIFDVSGNLYGTTEYGGNGSCDISNFGCGTVFEIKP
jgi:uncharacterized repeat protein (TIGR03803 family)